VTREGEDILSALDDWAIQYLRSQKLVWSGWGPASALGSLHTPIPQTSWGLRRVDVYEPNRLRLFLSLLWRAAAASQLLEFSEVKLPATDLDRLGKMIVGQEAGEISFCPASLTQLSTRGVVHNMTPIADIKQIPELEDVCGRSTAREIPIFRFYFDGLIAHVHRHATDDGYTRRLPSLFVGARNELTVTTVPYENSFEHENLSRAMSETIWRS
jgi:hypothetical protein